MNHELAYRQEMFEWYCTKITGAAKAVPVVYGFTSSNI